MALTGGQQAALYFARKRHRALSHVFVAPLDANPSEQPEQTSPVTQPKLEPPPKE